MRRLSLAWSGQTPFRFLLPRPRSAAPHACALNRPSPHQCAAAPRRRAAVCRCGSCGTTPCTICWGTRTGGRPPAPPTSPCRSSARDPTRWTSLYVWPLAACRRSWLLPLDWKVGLEGRLVSLDWKGGSGRWAAERASLSTDSRSPGLCNRALACRRARLVGPTQKDRPLNGTSEASGFPPAHGPGERPAPDLRTLSQVRAGDLIIGDARMLHAAHANTSDARRTVITLWFQVRASADNGSRFNALCSTHFPKPHKPRFGCGTEPTPLPTISKGGRRTRRHDAHSSL